MARKFVRSILWLAGSIFTGAATADDCQDYQGYGEYGEQQLSGTFTPAPANYAVVQAFTPLNYPWVYDGFCMCVRGDGVNTSFAYDIIVLDDDGPDGGPGTVLRKYPGEASLPSSNQPCNYVSTDGLEIPPLYSGSVYLGFAWEPTAEPGVAWGIDQSNNGVPPRQFRSTTELDSWDETTDNHFATQFRAHGELYCEHHVTAKLTVDSPTWNRVSAIASSLNCDAVAVDATENGQYYSAIPIRTDTAGNRLIFEIQTVTSGLQDTTLALYCNPFNPATPAQNLIAYDDDSGPGSLSGFTYDDNLTLAPDTLYWLVVSSFAPGATGTFVACLSNGYYKVDLAADTLMVDQNADHLISLSELLRVIQFYNSGALHCDSTSEDGYAPDAGDQTCEPYDADYQVVDWSISLSELLRTIQFYNGGGYHACPEEIPATEDGYCPGPA